LVNILKKNYNLNCKIFKNKDLYYGIAISNSSVDNLINLINPYKALDLTGKLESFQSQIKYIKKNKLRQV